MLFSSPNQNYGIAFGFRTGLANSSSIQRVNHIIAGSTKQSIPEGLVVPAQRCETVILAVRRRNQDLKTGSWLQSGED